jgi:hypothetical protein
MTFPTEEDMADIISLDDVRSTWRTAKADCVTCKHTWQAVFPDGAELGLECPNCHRAHGWACIPENGNREGTMKVLTWCATNKIGPYAP